MSFAALLTVLLGLFAPAAQYSDAALLPGDAAVAPSAGGQDRADAAPGGPGFLVAWQDDRATLNGTPDPGGVVAPHDIYAARLDASGNLLAPGPIIVTQQPFDQTRPRAAWNGTEWLVVWQGQALTQFYFSSGIFAARISAAGQLLDDPPIVIDDDEFVEELLMDVASDGNGWAVLWQDINASGGWTMSACQVSGSGAVSNKKTLLSFLPGAGSAWNGRLDWAQNRYLVAWEEFGSLDWSLKGMLLDASLAQIGSTFFVSNAAGDQTRCSVASNGSGFYVAWADERLGSAVYGTPVSTSGAVAVPGGGLVSGSYQPLYPIPAAAWNGASWTVLWEDWSLATGTSLIASLVDSAGAVQAGSPFTAVAAPSLTNPVAAPGSAGALAIWSDTRNGLSTYGDTRDLYACAVRPNGTVSATFCVSQSPPAQTHPDLAGGAHGSLAVFLSQTSGESRVLAQRLDFFGRPLDPQPFLIASGDPSLRRPAVAWNGSLYLVVWEKITPGGFPTGVGRILGRRVQPDGTILDPLPLDFMPGNGPDLAAVGDVFLVAASDEPINHARWIKAVRVQGSSGAVLDPAPLNLSSSYSHSPAVGAFADRWVVLWQQHTSHDSPYSAVYAALVPQSGGAGAPFLACNAGATDRAPAVAVEGAQAFFSWSDGSDVRGRFLQPNGTLLGAAAGQILSGAANEQFAPAVAWSGTQYLALWSDYRLHTNLVEPGIGDLYSTRVRSSGTVVDPAGLVFAAAPAATEGQAAVHGARGSFVACGSVLRSESDFATLRILVRGFGPTLEQSALHRGQPATFTVNGAEAGDLVVFVYSTAGAGISPPVAQLGGLTLDLLLPIQVFGQTTANSQGLASLTATVPAAAPLITVYTQAALRRGAAGSGSGKTGVVAAPILP